jgi:hypothetical protein
MPTDFYSSDGLLIFSILLLFPTNNNADGLSLSMLEIFFFFLFFFTLVIFVACYNQYFHDIFSPQFFFVDLVASQIFVTKFSNFLM